MPEMNGRENGTGDRARRAVRGGLRGRKNASALGGSGKFRRLRTEKEMRGRKGVTSAEGGPAKKT